MKIAPHARLAVFPPVLAAAFPLAFLAAPPAFSQTIQPAQTGQTTQVAQLVQPATSRQLTEMVVSATRSAQPIGDVVADVTVIDREALERAGPVGLADILARVPGIQITRNGGTGA